MDEHIAIIQKVEQLFKKWFVQDATTFSNKALNWNKYSNYSKWVYENFKLTNAVGG